ncbi:sugar kinase [Nakamurella deserti]|uniref:sugar kinase n=1 Tax=Nakamurella deserti TaxID=2164074 RepID=UPI000DBE94A8|nr:sugar kinase [Nakamurella deserti]
MTAAVVTLGETMALLTAPSGRHLRGGTQLPIGIGGAESNVAIGLARLDVPVTWISRVGDDAFGAMVTREIRAEGVRVVAAVDTTAPTGLMVKEHLHGTPVRVRYYRAGSAASRLSPADLDTPLIAGAQVLHLSGITAALSPTALETVREAIRIARDAGTLVSFDVNHRVALWSTERAAEVLRALCGQADLVFAGVTEAELVLGTPSGSAGEDALAAGLADLGPATVVLKLGAAGALARTDGATLRAAAEPIEVVDPVGAGDAFVAGYLSALTGGRPVDVCLRRGNQLGGAVCRVPGDWEGLPTRDELQRLGSHLEDVVR